MEAGTYNPPSPGRDWQEERDVEVWEMVPGYIVFTLMWLYFFYPPIQDIVILGFYLFYDTGSTLDIYTEDHETGWFYWAIGQGALSIGTIAFYIYMIIA
jgi:hypothetical protein